MSGTLIINDDAFWGPAGWVYNAVIEGSAKALAEINPELSSLLSASTTEMNAGYFNYEKLSPASKLQFRDAVQRVYEAYTDNPALFGDPKFYPGFMDRVKELIVMLDEDISMTG